MNSCKNCGGDMIGDGYTSVIHCEYADEEDYLYSAPDSGPFYCGYGDLPEEKELDFE